MAENLEVQRHGKSSLSDVGEFKKNLYMLGGLGTHVMPPHIHPETGAYVDGLLWLKEDKDGQQRVVPLSAAEGASPVALVFGSYTVMTQPDLDEFGALAKSRPLGDVAMNLRHLRKAGVRPVFVERNDLAKLGDNMARISLLRSRVLQDQSAAPDAEDWSCFH